MGSASEAKFQCEQFLDEFTDPGRGDDTAQYFVDMLIKHGFGDDSDGHVACYEAYGVEPLLETLNDAGWDIVEGWGNPNRFTAQAPGGGRITYIDGYVYLSTTRP